MYFHVFNNIQCMLTAPKWYTKEKHKEHQNINGNKNNINNNNNQQQKKEKENRTNRQNEQNERNPRNLFLVIQGCYALCFILPIMLCVACLYIRSTFVKSSTKANHLKHLPNRTTTITDNKQHKMQSTQYTPNICINLYANAKMYNIKVVQIRETFM